MRQKSNSISSTIQVSATEFDQIDLFGPLPYVIDINALGPLEKKRILELNLATARALCVNELANQQLNSARNQNSSKDTEMVHSNHDEILSLLVFTLGLFQYVIDQCKSFIPELDNYANEELSAKIYVTSIDTIIQFVKEKFNECLEAADEFSCQTLQTNTDESFRSAERIIYEAAINTSKHGAISELRNEPFVGLYKTGILLLQSLIQPCWDGNSKLDKEDEKTIHCFLDQLYGRLASVGQHRE